MVETNGEVVILVVNKCEDGDKGNGGGDGVHGGGGVVGSSSCLLLSILYSYSDLLDVHVDDDIVLLVIQNDDSDDGDGCGYFVGCSLYLALSVLYLH